MRIVLCMGAMALATVGFSQTWLESGDAPEGVPTSQMTFGTGALSSIVGRLDRPGGDHADTYCIRITSQTEFFATTKQSFGGSALTAAGSNADTRLWLWGVEGNVLLGNDDVNTASLGTDTLASFLSDPSTFAAFTGGELVNATASAIVLNPGIYLLSISEFSNDPDDSAGVDLANLGSDFDALHGPNPAAGGFSSWENAVDTTVIDYTIALRGAGYCEVVPEPATIAALSLGALGTFFRRRKR